MTTTASPFKPPRLKRRSTSTLTVDEVSSAYTELPYLSQIVASVASTSGGHPLPKCRKTRERDVAYALEEAVGALTSRKMMEDQIKQAEAERQKGKLFEYEAELRRVIDRTQSQLSEGESSAMMEASPRKRLSSQSPSEKKKRIALSGESSYSRVGVKAEAYPSSSELMPLVPQERGASNASSWYPYDLLTHEVQDQQASSADIPTMAPPLTDGPTRLPVPAVGDETALGTAPGGIGAALTAVDGPNAVPKSDASARTVSEATPWAACNRIHWPGGFENGLELLALAAASGAQEVPETPDNAVLTAHSPPASVRRRRTKTASGRMAAKAVAAAAAAAAAVAAARGIFQTSDSQTKTRGAPAPPENAMEALVQAAVSAAADVDSPAAAEATPARRSRAAVLSDVRRDAGGDAADSSASTDSYDEDLGGGYGGAMSLANIERFGFMRRSRSDFGAADGLDLPRAQVSLYSAAAVESASPPQSDASALPAPHPAPPTAAVAAFVREHAPPSPIGSEPGAKPAARRRRPSSATDTAAPSPPLPPAAATTAPARTLRSSKTASSPDPTSPAAAAPAVYRARSRSGPPSAATPASLPPASTSIAAVEAVPSQALAPRRRAARYRAATDPSAVSAAAPR
ncbi:hypothetical protein HK405_005605 [Cladochytrium tenue]|nr:hypothetical protein HK405_005605 [Cladochytrium tenue]